MADKKRFLDIWIVDIQKVYREVPYNVVVDWVQQGRLLEDDRLRPSGTAEWLRLGDYGDLQPFLPKPEPHRAEDQAEALEPVQLDFSYKKYQGDEDEDVDMIPLIDVSLVLLVFFMMTAAGGAAPLLIPVPNTEFSTTLGEPQGIMLGIDLIDENGKKVPVYSLSEGSAPPAREDRNLRTREELLQRLDAKLAGSDVRFEVTINAHKDVQSGLVRDLTVELDKAGRRVKIAERYIGVTEEAP